MHSYAERSVKLPGPHLLFGPDFSVSDRRSGDVSGDVSILDVTGPLRGERAAQAFRRYVWDLLNEGVKKLAVNLTEAGDIDSGGLGALAAAYNQVKQDGGRIAFFGAPPRVSRTLTKLRLDTVFAIFKSEDDAVAACARPVHDEPKSQGRDQDSRAWTQAEK